MSIKTKSVVLAQSPKGHIVPSETFSIQNGPTYSASDLKDGQILVETLYLSLDPVMRCWIDETKASFLRIKEGETMQGAAMTRVMASRHKDISQGDVGISRTGWVTHAIVAGEAFQRVDRIEHTQLTDYMSILSSNGLAGYVGMNRVGQPKQGETVVVSAAAGATGNVAAQAAKIKGARVIGIAGSNEKVKWLKEGLGLDEALNYNDADFEDQYVKVIGGGIDVYFDTVGGYMLDLALKNLNHQARIAICGSVSSYNSENPHGLRNYLNLAFTNSTMGGVNVFTYESVKEQTFAEMGVLLKEGKLKRSQTVIQGTLEEAPNALLELFKGRNTGKMLLQIKEI